VAECSSICICLSCHRSRAQNMFRKPVVKFVTMISKEMRFLSRSRDILYFRRSRKQELAVFNLSSNFLKIFIVSTKHVYGRFHYCFHALISKLLIRWLWSVRIRQWSVTGRSRTVKKLYTWYASSQRKSNYLRLKRSLKKSRRSTNVLRHFV